MKKKIYILVLATTLNSIADNSCVSSYSATTSSAKKTTPFRSFDPTKIGLGRAQKPTGIQKVKEDQQIYYPMFVKAFETEFGVQMLESFQQLLNKVILFPEKISAEEAEVLKNGSYDAQGNYRQSDLKYYFGFNHLTIKSQERAAEKLLSEFRQKELPSADRKKLELSQMELAVLRFSKLIGRDYDLFDGTKREVDQAAIKEMKYNFLKYFSFAGKELSKEEFELLYNEKVIVDDPMGEQRYDLAQEYNPQYVTNEMILARNARRLKQLAEHESSYRKEQRKEIAGNKEKEKQLEELNTMLAEDDVLRASIETLRREYWYNEGRDSNFDRAEDMVTFVSNKSRQLQMLKQKLQYLADEIDFKTLSKVLRPNHEYKTFLKELETKKYILSSSKATRDKLLEFLKTKNGEEVFRIAREVVALNKSVSESLLNKTIEEKLEHFDRLYDFANKDINLSYFELIRQTKMIKTALTEAEAMDIFRIMTYTSGIRLIDIIKYDPASKFGFCFGRAFFGNLIMLQNGIHRDSIKKVFVYGPMKGGLFGWGFHVAVMVAKEGGGYWVLDPSHGKIETIESWYAHYEKASKDGRIKMDIAKGDRFGRTGFSAASWDSLRNDYDSVLNEKFGTKYKYFVDVLKVLSGSKFAQEKDKSLFTRGFDKAMEMFGIGL